MLLNQTSAVVHLKESFLSIDKTILLTAHHPDCVLQILTPWFASFYFDFLIG